MPGACCIGTAANVRPAVEQDFEKAGDSGIMKVRERFRLDLSDEEAVKEMQNLLQTSVTAFLPKVMEAVHVFATKGR